MRMYSFHGDVTRQSKQTLRWIKEGMVGGDKELEDLLINFNSIDGIATKFCCASHPDRKENNFYIMFSCTKRGYESLQRIYLRVLEVCDKSSTNEIDHVALTMEPCWTEGFTERYMAIYIRNELFTALEKHRFIGVLNSVSKSYSVKPWNKNILMSS